MGAPHERGAPAKKTYAYGPTVVLGERDFLTSEVPLHSVEYEGFVGAVFGGCYVTNSAPHNALQ